MLQITPGERTALELLANGRSIAEIATTLDVRVSEVEWHLASLFSRMGVTSHTEAVAAASRRGLLRWHDAPAGTPAAIAGSTPCARRRRNSLASTCERT